MSLSSANKTFMASILHLTSCPLSHEEPPHKLHESGPASLMLIDHIRTSPSIILIRDPHASNFHDKLHLKIFGHKATFLFRGANVMLRDNVALPLIMVTTSSTPYASHHQPSPSSSTFSNPRASTMSFWWSMCKIYNNDKPRFLACFFPPHLLCLFLPNSSHGSHHKSGGQGGEGGVEEGYHEYELAKVQGETAVGDGVVELLWAIDFLSP
ncbi:hypothetical protein Fmac_025591 [Flemingia macrophylla]|uniref:Uncharacterized protein n=1 Tax=Flemingia macrophylla TaxID=520843 RepID=A0ABD1LSM6_9FABA